MSIRIEITGESTQEIAQNILQMALMIAPRLAGGPVQQPAEEPAVAAESVIPPKKPGRQKKADAPVIEHDEKETVDVHGQGGMAAADGAGDQERGSVVSGGDGAGAPESRSDASEQGAGQAETVTTGEAAAASPGGAPAGDEKAAPKDVVDPIRANVINEYLNVVTDSLPVRKELYKALLEEFSIPAITDLKPSQIEAFKASVAAKIAAAVKA